MSANKSKRRVKVAPAAGVMDVLYAKARGRRDRQRVLHEIADHAPARRNDLLPKLTVSSLPIERLMPALRQARRRSETQVARIRASIEKFGVCQPVLVDSANRIVDCNEPPR